MKIARVSCFVAFAVATFLTTFSALADELRLTAQQMREDLAVLEHKWAPLDKSFSDEQRRAFNRQIDEIAAAADALAPEEFAFEVMRTVALARNGHTNANVARFLGDDLPVRAWWFADGLYIVKAHPNFRRLLGARIERIGTLSAEEAHSRLRPYLAGTDQRARFLSPGYLVTPSMLNHVGATRDSALVALTVRLPDDRSETVELRSVSGGDPGDERRIGLNRGYSVLIPDPEDVPGRWAHVLDNIAERPRIYRARGDVSGAFLDHDQEVLYVRNDTVASIDDTPLVDKFASIIRDMILPSQPKHIVVDLRFNNGGDFFHTILFAQALPRLVPDDGRVIVLIGRATFSAGIVTAAMIKGAGREKVTFIGETMGDGGQFWAEGEKVTLPNSGIGVRYSGEFEDYEEGCTDTRSCYWATVAFGPRGISLAPDVAIDATFADYAAGRDPTLDRALELAR